ncbi:hypothetical protein H5P28_01165 [Ruficoccus amylovorans]|uniref:Pycsar effector protein domain-containing protein n=1 Tax=Ruficoccus amylovorans TaxID=1804625 RepID=A0A842H9Q3_9BACT|nr:hypothetical protein [Ruficoccus amylovorans]MBC2592859.1 hypothetical protein [Ruficoccus amylovorans]
MNAEDELKLSHAKECFANMHSISRFIDGKTVALTSLILLVLGGMAFIIKFVLKLEEPRFEGIFALPCVDFIALELAVLSCVASICSIFFCVATNIARLKLTSKHTALFPIHVDRYENIDLASSEMFDLLQGMDVKKMLEEYSDQLTNLGRIVARKFFWYRLAVGVFFVQAVWGVVALGLFLMSCSAR